jgi:hypothetical protein
MYNYGFFSNDVQAVKPHLYARMTFMAEMTIKKRPKNLDLTTIRLPLAGKVSILHRVSGAGCSLFSTGDALAVFRPV